MLLYSTNEWAVVAILSNTIKLNPPQSYRALFLIDWNKKDRCSLY